MKILYESLLLRNLDNMTVIFLNQLINLYLIFKHENEQLLVNLDIVQNRNSLLFEGKSNIFVFWKIDWIWKEGKFIKKYLQFLLFIDELGWRDHRKLLRQILELWTHLEEILPIFLFFRKFYHFCRLALRNIDILVLVELFSSNAFIYHWNIKFILDFNFKLNYYFIPL